MQLTIDSHEPLQGVLAAVGGLYGVELRVAGAEPNAEAVASKPARRRGRVTAKKATATRARVRAGLGGTSHADPGEIRAWARTNGHQVKERGRIPADVLAAYRAAHR